MTYREPIETLKGKVIRDLRMNQELTIIQFITDEGKHTFYAEPDCCSECWFEDITDKDVLFDAEILSVEDVHLGQVVDKLVRQEMDQQYAIKFLTTKGYCDIIWRNSSNGYYGGSLVDYTETPDDNLTSLRPVAT